MAKFIANFGYEGVDHLLGTKGMSSYGSKQGRHKQRRFRAKSGAMYKPAASYGWRGSPKTSTRPGSVPAPTIDQVRNIERAYLLKIDVHRGIMYFKDDQTVFNHEEANMRRHNTYRAMVAEAEQSCMLACRGIHAN
jgi:hypothetical protein